MSLVLVADTVSEFLWSVPAVFGLLGVGLYLSLLTKGIQFRRLPHALKLLLRSVKQNNAKGEISSAQALAVSLAGTVGAGNITGVASAISLGGPGAIFWMWMTALIGMATTFSCCTLAVAHREKDSAGRTIGGPMYVLKNALNMPKMGAVFAICTVFATIGSGNMIPANAMMDGLSYLYPAVGLHKLFIAIFFAIMVSVVVVGGVKSIGRWMGKIVPFMCGGYILGVLYIICSHISAVPHAFYTIFVDALNPYAVGGGAVGTAIHYGVARGLFSNEAGQGSLPMIHALAKTETPHHQGYLAMLGPFIDTIVVCTLTALVILVTGAHGQDVPQSIQGSQVAIYAFQLGLGSWGTWIVSIGLLMFAYSTIVAWAYYGEAAIKYLCKENHDKAILAYRVIYSAVVILGATLQLQLVWDICDIAMVFMMLPNLLCVVLLSKSVRAYVDKAKDDNFSSLGTETSR